MDLSVTQLFALIRSGLWKEQPDLSLFGNNTNWNEVFQLAQKQTVLGFVVDGLSMLPAALQPSKGMQIKAHSLLIRTTQHHHLLNNVISELSSRLEKEGIRSVLLKGQGLAQNYPDPFKRTCGDIDLYVGNHNYKKTCQLLKQWGMLEGETKESGHHLHFFYKEVPIEIHRITGILYGLSRNKRFRKWSDTLLQSEECRSCNLGGETVYLPPIRFDAMFIFYHMYRHLITGGVGLRQLCDCVMYLHKFKDEINRDLLHEDLCRMGLLRLWKIFGCIAVHHLGLPKEEFPFFTDTVEAKELSEFLLEEVILRNGNFGHYNPDKQARPKGYLAGKLFSLRNTLLYLRKMQRIFGSEILNFLLFYIYKGISNILHDTVYGKKKK